MKKISDEAIKSLCDSKELKLIDRFVKNNQTYLRCVCFKHCKPYEFEVAYNDLRVSKHSCRKCAGKDMTTDDIKYRVETVLKSPVKIIGEYVNMKTPITTLCLKCNTPWEANVVSLCQGSCCPKCKNSKPKKSHSQFVLDLEKVQPNLIVTSEYCGDSQEITYKCKIDGYEGKTVAGRLLTKNTQCTCCSKRKMHNAQCLTQEEFESRLNVINPNIKVLSQYTGWNEMVTLQCTLHNTIYLQRGGGALDGKCGCSKCVSSKGEKRIADILKSLGVSYKTQFKFEGCRDKNLLPFDFYIPSLNMCIEYQGEQHYHPVQFGNCSMASAISSMNMVQKHDRIKADYCQSKGIKLLAIPYKEFDNLEKIIKECV